jgi:RNA recognition motif-containing protein
VAAFNDKEINGRELKLQIATEKVEKPKAERATGEKKAKSVKKPTEPKKEKTFSKTILFVGNLPFEVTDKVLENLFVETGLKINQAKIVTNTNNGRSKGFGFVEFDDESELETAIEKFVKAQLDGRELEVKRAFEGVTL